MEKQAKVTVKGTGQLNGSKTINKTVTMDASMAKQFTGGSRYDVIEDFVRTHYPGMKFNPKNFSANVIYNVSSNDNSSSKGSFLGRIFGSNNDEEEENEEIVTKPKVEKTQLTEEQKELLRFRDEEDKRQAKLKDEEYQRAKKIKEDEFNRQHKLNLDELNKIEQQRINKEAERNLLKSNNENSRIEKINALIDLHNLNSPQEIETHLENLLISISGFSLSKEHQNENFYNDKMINKYKICLEKLKVVSENPERLKYFIKEYKKIRNKRVLGKIIGFIKSLDASNQQ